MKSLFPPQAYISEEWFAREQDLLMRPLWQFVAPLALLNRHNTFVTRHLAGVHVVVQNFDGEIKAFENNCLHRLTPIQTETEGRRPLVCGYHGWRYDVDGKVAKIPFDEECYRLKECETARLKLREFAVHVLGGLVFVNVGARPLPFDEQFGPEVQASIKAASEAFDDEVLITTFPARFNWKLAYENLRDALHPRFVHPATLYKRVKFQTPVDDTQLPWLHRYREHGSAHRASHLAVLRGLSNGGENEPIPDMPRYAWHANVQRHGERDWYLNWLLFPNLHIASASGGHAFIIEHHQPVSAARTDLTVYYVTARKTRAYPTSAAVLLAHIEGAEPVLREDIEIMEQVQAGLAPDSPAGTLGDFEQANLTVERWYMDVMDGRHEL